MKGLANIDFKTVKLSIKRAMQESPIAEEVGLTEVLKELDKVEKEQGDASLILGTIYSAVTKMIPDLQEIEKQLPKMT